MENYGITSISTFLDDMLVYRNLEPMDRRLPPYRELADFLDMTPASPPRKTDPDYARVMAHLLSHARKLTAEQADLERLIYIGDTRMSDGTAFQNLCRAGSWRGIAFIGNETSRPPSVDVVEESNGSFYLANRWSMLDDFEQYCIDHGFTFDEGTALILDLDKTAVGARGRNDHVINEARLTAVGRTVAITLGDAFDPEEFKRAYDLFNSAEFHPFTTDNQDYLAYLCLILGSGLYTCTVVADDIRSGELSSFQGFMAAVDEQSEDLPSQLRDLHEEIYERVREGDPTPFKAFRRQEYLTTVARMGHLAPDADADLLLADEIVVTQEVREIALAWKMKGALLFGLSDKPDEASIPTDTLAAKGYASIHRTRTHAVGAGAKES